MSLAQSIKNFFANQAQQIANAQASQEAFQDALTKKVEEKGLDAVSRARNPLAL